MKLFKEVYKRKCRRLKSFADPDGLLKEIQKGTVLAFDVSGILPAIEDIKGEIKIAQNGGFDSFRRYVLRTRLPSDIVWLEWLNPDGRPEALVLTSKGKTFAIAEIGAVLMRPEFGMDYSDCNDFVEAALWLINTPNLTRRTLVSARPKRKSAVASSAWMAGDYEKIELCIDGKVIDVNVSGEKHGKRPYHFVRGHIKKCFGRQIYVDGYWRGNKEYGIRNHQYECTTKRSLACI